MNSTLLDLRESVVLEEHQRAEDAEAELAALKDIHAATCIDLAETRQALHDCALEVEAYKSDQCDDFVEDKRELERKYTEQMQRAEQAEAALIAKEETVQQVSWWMAYAMGSTAALVAAIEEDGWRAKKAEAELAALKGRLREEQYVLNRIEMSGKDKMVAQYRKDWQSDFFAHAEEGTTENTYAGQCWGGTDTPDERARAEEGSE
jgi:chromosome segregation ATPase